MTNPYSPLNKLAVIMAEQSVVINDSNLLEVAAGAGGERRRHLIIIHIVNNGARPITRSHRCHPQ